MISERLGKTDRNRLRRSQIQLELEDIRLEDCKYASARLTLHGLNSVVDQLGYLPRNIIEIVAGEESHPTVIQLYPLNTLILIPGTVITPIFRYFFFFSSPFNSSSSYSFTLLIPLL